MSTPYATKNSTRAEKAASHARSRAEIAGALKNGPLTVQAIAATLGRDVLPIRGIIPLMIESGEIESERVPIAGTGKGGATSIALYHLGRSISRKCVEVADCAEINRPRPKVYALNHARDPLHAALFGPARRKG